MKHLTLASRRRLRGEIVRIFSSSSISTHDDLADDRGGNYTGIIAYYRDAKSGTEKSITAGDQSKPQCLRNLYSSKNSAQRAIDREWTNQ